MSAVPEVDLQPIIGGSADSNEMFVVSHNERSLANRQNVRAAWNDVSPWSAKTGTMFTKQVSSNKLALGSQLEAVKHSSAILSLSH